MIQTNISGIIQLDGETSLEPKDLVSELISGNAELATRILSMPLYIALVTKDVIPDLTQSTILSSHRLVTS